MPRCHHCVTDASSRFTFSLPRLRLYLVPLKHYPQVPFVRRVPTWKMHLFTLVQVLALAMLWAVKSSPFSLALPFFLIMMVPTRHMLEKIFSPLELRAVITLRQPGC